MAGLIPQAFIDDLLHRADIVDVIDKRVSLKKQGKNYGACCPFHQEKTPSFSVQPEKQFYYCFGCGAGGNAIGFIMNFDQVEFPQAVEVLAKDNGMEVPREESKAESKRHSENAGLLAVTEDASKFYQQQIRKHENKNAAVNYLKERGLSGEIARDFCVGYAPPGWDNLLKAVGTDGKQQMALLKAGLVVERDRDKDTEKTKGKRENDSPYYDRFRHRIIFPIRDSRGRTIAFGGRVLDESKPKYLNSPETPIFHKGAELYGLYEAKKSVSKLNRILIVEGYMDVIALAQMGIRNAVATLGTATSERHLLKLFRLVPEVGFCFDGDAAGRKAAWRALENSIPQMEDGRQIKFLFLDEGEDPDTLVRKIGEQAFNQQIDEATSLEQFFFDKLSQGIDVKTIEGKARLSNLAKPLIKKFPRGVYGQLMLDRLSNTLGLGNESLEQLFKDQPDVAAESASIPPGYPEAGYDSAPQERNDGGFSRPSFSRQSASNNSKNSSNLGTYRKPASLKAIELLLRNPEIALSITEDLAPLHTAEDESRKLLLSLIEMVKRDPSTETYTMLGYCYGSSLGNQLTRLFKGEKITPQEGIEEEFKQILDSILSDISKKLEKMRLKRELADRFQSSQDIQEDIPPISDEPPGYLADQAQDDGPIE